MTWWIKNVKGKIWTKTALQYTWTCARRYRWPVNTLLKPILTVFVTIIVDFGVKLLSSKQLEKYFKYLVVVLHTTLVDTLNANRWQNFSFSADVDVVGSISWQVSSTTKSWLVVSVALSWVAALALAPTILGSQHSPPVNSIYGSLAAAIVSSSSTSVPSLAITTSRSAVLSIPSFSQLHGHRFSVQTRSCFEKSLLVA